MIDSITSQLNDELNAMKSGGTYKQEKVISGFQGTEIEVEGKKFLNFCANNYLGLAGSEKMREVTREGIAKYGFGMASVRFICGTGTVHKELEAEIASFFRMDDAILYSSCFDANTGLFETILAEGDAVISDELNHASVIDGIRLCKAERLRFLHSNMEDLEAKLKEATGGLASLASLELGRSGPKPAREGGRRILIATDGVFSMDGETAKLGAIADLAEKYGALLMVDDSHASGVLGETGRGSIEQCGVMDRVDILTSTFGKALGGASGGFTAGRKEIVEYLRQRSRPYLFSNTLAPAVAYAAKYVLENFDREFLPLRETLMERMRYFRNGMERIGFTLGGDGTHPITPVMLFEEPKAMAMADALLERGIYVRGFTYPVVPKGKARVRVQISAAHTKEHLDRALEAFAEVAKKN